MERDERRVKKPLKILLMKNYMVRCIRAGRHRLSSYTDSGTQGLI